MHVERTRRSLRLLEHIRGHLWDRHFIKPWWWPWYFRSDDLSLTNRNHWLCNVLVNNISLSRTLQLEPQALEYRMNWVIHTLYESSTGMVLNINGKFTIGKLKLSLFLQSYVLNLHSLSISRCTVKVSSTVSCGIIYSKLNGVYAINKIIKLRIT